MGRRRRGWKAREEAEGGLLSGVRALGWDAGPEARAVGRGGRTEGCAVCALDLKVGWGLWLRCQTLAALASLPDPGDARGVASKCSRPVLWIHSWTLASARLSPCPQVVERPASGVGAGLFPQRGRAADARGPAVGQVREHNGESRALGGDSS